MHVGVLIGAKINVSVAKCKGSPFTKVNGNESKALGSTGRSCVARNSTGNALQHRAKIT